MPELNRRTFLTWSAAVSAAALAAPMLPAALANAATGTAPPLDSLTSDWLPQTDLAHLPALANFWGGANVANDLAGIQNLTLPPYVQGGSCLALTVDGAALATATSRWSAYEILREATTASGLEIRSATRLAFEANQLLVQLTVTNPTAAPVTTALSLGLNPRIRKVTSGWSWSVPRPGDANFTAQTSGSANVVVTDNSGPAVTAFAVDGGATLSASGSGGTAAWSLTLASGTTRTLNIVMAIADSTAAVTTANTTLQNFPSAFSNIASAWSARWTQAFTPGNPHYSGSLPVLTPERTPTGDAIGRLYYMSILSVLCCERTNLGSSFNTLLGRTGSYAGFDRVYVTASPEYAPTVTYFWDTSYCSVLLALLDPAMMRAQTKYWLSKDIHNCYAVECIQGGTVGPWYSANDLTVSTTILNYLDYSGDLGYLQDTVNGTSVLQALTNSATYWKSLVPAGGKLADYGGAGNLLEVLPKYTNQVASFNAANVWLMNQAATLQQNAGNTATAASLRSSASSLLPDVLALYVAGQGVWNCRHPDGTLVPVRTVVDFAIGSNLVADHLTAQQKTEMKSFVTGELLDGDWMRALSLSDSESPVDRPDHGTSGAYDSWPALTAQTFARFGDYPAFLQQLTTFSGVTGQGPFGQAHQLANLGPSVADRPALNPAAALTVSAWINAGSWPAQIWQGSIVAKDTWANGNGGYVLRGGAGGAISFAVVVGGSWTDLHTTATVPTGGWHHVAGVYDGAAMRIYIDGVQQASQALTGTLTGSVGTPVVIGSSPADSTRAFLGGVDEPRVYSRALSASEIAAAFHASSGTVGTGDPALAMRVPTNNGAVTTVADSPALNPTAALTLSAWVDATGWPSQIWQGDIVAKDTWSAGDKGYVLRGGAGGRISFAVVVNGHWTDVQTTATVPSGAWHHVAGVYDGATAKVYIDGVLQASQALSGPLTPSTGTSLHIGDSPADSTRTFLGTVNDARVYGRALSAAEIAAEHAGGVAGGKDVDPALVVRLPFDEGSSPSTTETVTGSTAAVNRATWTTGRTGFGSALAFSASSAVGVIAGDVMTFNEVCGGKFADVIISDLFGYTPDGTAPALKDAGVARGMSGTLSGVIFQGTGHTITSSATGLSITAG